MKILLILTLIWQDFTNISIASEPSIHRMRSCYEQLNFLNHDNSIDSLTKDHGPASIFGIRQGQKGIYIFDESWVSFCKLSPALLKVDPATTLGKIKVIDVSHNVEAYIRYPGNATNGQFLQRTKFSQGDHENVKCEASKNDESISIITQSLENEAGRAHSGYLKQLEFAKRGTPPPITYAQILPSCLGINSKLDKIIKLEVEKFPLSSREKTSTARGVR